MKLNVVLASSVSRILGLLLPIIVVLIIVAILTYIARRIRNRVRALTGLLPNATSIAQMRRALESTRPSMPRSLQSMEHVVLPQIAKDFPELNIESMRSEVTRDLNDFFSDKLRQREDLPENLRRYSAWWAGFAALKLKPGQFDGQSVYKVVIKDYNKEENRRHIIWQAGFYYDDGQNSGLTERVDVVYTYELKQEGTNAEVVTIGMRCPSCGAPVEHVGAKVCRYCQTPLNANWDMVWKLSAVRSA